MKENQYLEFLEGENRSYDELTAKGNEFHFSILEQKLKEQLGVSAINSDILRTLGLLGVDGKYKNAGALLADENSFYGIDCARFGDSIDIILDREIFEHKSILKQYDEAVTLYRKYYQYDEIEGALRKTVELIPEKAFREAIANALVHRTWDVNSHIRIAMFKDRLEVFFPGRITKRNYARRISKWSGFRAAESDCCFSFLPVKYYRKLWNRSSENEYGICRKQSKA